MRPAMNVSGPLATEDRPSLAIVLVLAVMLTFVVMDSLAKLLAGSGMPPEVIIMLRYTLVLAALVPVVAYHWRSRPHVTQRPRLHFFRGALQAGSATTFVYALKFLPLETATAIGFVSPLYITALSVPFLGEKVGPRRWAAVVLGFGGVLMILRPGSAEFQPAMLLPLMTSFFWACSLIITRAMRGTEKPLTVMLWSTGTGFVLVAPFGIASWTAPNAEQWALLASMAGCHLLAQYLMIRAYMLASASILAPFSYTTLIWAMLIGILVFGSYPDLLTVVGASVLAGAGLYVWHRERIVTGRTSVPRDTVAESASQEDKAA
jgi:drug/metabolite transporter (DMT)-like permease